MVAMTVILTAVLYMMVIGLAGTGEDSILWGGFAVADDTSNTTFEITFGKFSQTVRPTRLIIIVEFGDDTGTYNFASNEDGELGLAEGVDVCDIYYVDISNNGLVNQGDILRFSNASPGGTYTVHLFDMSTGDFLDQREVSLPG